MNFPEAVRSGFRNWRQYGRASRSEYWWWMLFYVLTAFGGLFVIDLLPRAFEGFALLWVAALLLLAVPTLSLQVRRLHDTNRSGWWLLLNFFPYIGAVLVLALLGLNGSPGPNRFGARPGGNLPTYRPEVPLIGVADELQKLEQLRTAGTISDEEHARLRGRLLPD